MQAFSEGRLWRCRIWVKEGPEMIEPSIGIVEQRIPGGDLSREPLKEAAVEMFVDRGEHWFYALLHALYTPDSSDSLAVKVHIAPDKGELLHDSLAPRWEKVHRGIPSVYAPAVLRSACSKCGTLGFQNGTLVFDTGAHGLICSSEKAFSVVAGVLISLLVHPFKELNQEALQSFADAQDCLSYFTKFRKEPPQTDGPININP